MECGLMWIDVDYLSTLDPPINNQIVSDKVVPDLVNLFAKNYAT